LKKPADGSRDAVVLAEGTPPALYHRVDPTETVVLVDAVSSSPIAATFLRVFLGATTGRRRWLATAANEYAGAVSA
jgi:hypothetical protein